MKLIVISGRDYAFVGREQKIDRERAYLGGDFPGGGKLANFQLVGED